METGQCLSFANLINRDVTETLSLQIGLQTMQQLLCVFSNSSVNCLTDDPKMDDPVSSLTNDVFRAFKKYFGFILLVLM